MTVQEQIVETKLKLALMSTFTKLEIVNESYFELRLLSFNLYRLETDRHREQLVDFMKEIMGK